MSSDHDQTEAGWIPTVGELAAKIRSFADMDVSDAVSGNDQAGLAETLQLHKAWVESLADLQSTVSGRRARFCGLDLRGVNFSKRDLRGADFTGANLEGAFFQNCQLMLANFNGARLRHADLRGARTAGASFEGADLEGALRDEGEK